METVTATFTVDCLFSDVQKIVDWWKNEVNSYAKLSWSASGVLRKHIVFELQLPKDRMVELNSSICAFSRLIYTPDTGILWIPGIVVCVIVGGLILAKMLEVCS